MSHRLVDSTEQDFWHPLTGTTNGNILLDHSYQAIFDALGHSVSNTFQKQFY